MKPPSKPTETQNTHQQTHTHRQWVFYYTNDLIHKQTSKQKTIQLTSYMDDYRKWNEQTQTTKEKYNTLLIDAKQNKIKPKDKQ